MKAIMLSMLRISAPYLLAASAGVLSERAGVINFALEGLMLCAAFVAATAAIASGSLWVGTGAAIVAGALLALGYYALTAFRRSNQVLLGIAFNLAALGATRFLLKLAFDSASNSPRVESEAVLGPLVPIALLLTWVLFEKTAQGVRITAAGDAPSALGAQGLSVRRVRALALAASGALLGLAGAYLVSGQHQFTDGMTAGRGYIAVAAVVLGGWRLVPVLLACALFSLAEAAELGFQSLELVPSQLVQMIPYLVCLGALVLRRSASSSSGTLRAPHALGD